MFLAQEVPDDVLARFAQYVIDFLSFPFTFHEGVISWLLPSRSQSHVSLHWGKVSLSRKLYLANLRTTSFQF